MPLDQAWVRRPEVVERSKNCSRNPDRVTTKGYLPFMTTIQALEKYMATRRRVLLDDGREGEIVRIDTQLPSTDTTVSVWTGVRTGLAKVRADAVVGPAPGAKLA